MYLSLVCVVSLIAAGSIAKPCSKRAKAQAGFPAPLQYTNTSTPSVSVIANPSAGGAPSSGGSCPAGFLNVVLNTGATKQPGWPETIWSTLTKSGIHEWIGFSLGTLDTKPTYNTNSGPAPVNPDLNAAQLHQIMDPTDSAPAVTMLKNNPPPYLVLFNEPDYSYMGLTPITDPISAAQSLQQVFAAKNPSTTFISPALAYPSSSWLGTFRDNCNNCFDQIPIIAMHLYSASIPDAMSRIAQLHSAWPDKKIWITEFSPTSPDCTLDSSGIVNWIHTIIPQVLALGYVEKIFWNSADYSATGPNNGAPSSCNPSLTTADGSGTPILSALGEACGPGGTEVGSVATSKF